MLDVFKKIRSIIFAFFLSLRIKKIIQISIILLAIFSIASISFAQESVSDSISSVYITSSPLSPRAGDSVVLTLQSDSINLDSSSITWYIDAVARKETTSKSITIKAKSNGENTIVRVVVETSDGIVKDSSITIIPSGIDLVVEPMSYTMPFYKGKPYFASQGTVKIVALPDITINGVKALSKNLIFKWTNDDTVLGSYSGKGKDSIVISGSIPVKDLNIGVQILDSSSNILVSTSKTIAITDPKILFYENSSLYGVLYNKAITGNYYLGTKEELQILAKPFSFNFSNDTASNTSYSWYINGNPVSASGKVNELLMRQTTTNLANTASIQLQVANTSKILQNTTAGFNIEYGE
jgi:hypothetical protein